MRVLVVGAGAVGRVYARHLSEGGAEVSFYVRPSRRDEAAAGYVLHRVRSRRRRERAHVRPASVLCSPGEVRSERFDQLWLCIPTDALASMADLLDAAGDAVVVSLVPGLEVRAWLEERVPGERLVIGQIGMISYEAPLEGSDAPYERATPPGTAYYLAPLGSAFGGPRAAITSIVATLRRGACPARTSASADLELMQSSAVLLPVVAALELDGWRFAALRRGHVGLAAAAGREALRVVAARTKTRRPLYALFVRGWILALASWLAPVLAPLDVETFFAVHFRKVGAQTRHVLAGYVAEGEARGLDVASLVELAGSLAPAARPDPKPDGATAAAPSR